MGHEPFWKRNITMLRPCLISRDRKQGGKGTGLRQETRRGDRFIFGYPWLWGNLLTPILTVARGRKGSKKDHVQEGIETLIFKKEIGP